MELQEGIQHAEQSSHLLLGGLAQDQRCTKMLIPHFLLASPVRNSPTSCQIHHSGRAPTQAMGQHAELASRKAFPR